MPCSKHRIASASAGSDAVECGVTDVAHPVAGDVEKEVAHGEQSVLLEVLVARLVLVGRRGRDRRPAAKARETRREAENILQYPPIFYWLNCLNSSMSLQQVTWTCVTALFRKFG